MLRFTIPSILSILALALTAVIVTPGSRIKRIRAIGLTASMCALLFSLPLLLNFNKSVCGFQSVWGFGGLSKTNAIVFFGIDGISLLFLMLTLFVFPMCFLASWPITCRPKHFYAYLLMMELLLVLTFTTLDLLYFYIFFEGLLIPMFIMIGVWGARERKIKAAYYFFLYTLGGSLFMLFGIIYLFLTVGSTSYFVLCNYDLASEEQKVVWLCFFVAFAVKMPLFPAHIWLPEAHVEAPTVGSMLLASLLLKLGGYGFLRFSLTLLAEASEKYAPLVCTLGVLGVVYGSFSTLRQIDLKRVIAYSSVAHMNLVVLGLFSSTPQGVAGAIFLMVSHGVVSAAMFFCVGIIYDRYHSRLLKYYGGLASVMPMFSTFFFLFTLANMSFPGTSNFLGELLIFIGLFSKNSGILILASAGIVLSAVYSTWTFNRIAFGVLKTQYVAGFTDINRREFFVLTIFLIAMACLGLNANFVLSIVGTPIAEIFSRCK